MENGHKTTFSNSKDFAACIKWIIGMSFILLDRLQDGLDVLFDLGV